MNKKLILFTALFAGTMVISNEVCASNVLNQDHHTQKDYDATEIIKNATCRLNAACGDIAIPYNEMMAEEILKCNTRDEAYLKIRVFEYFLGILTQEKPKDIYKNDILEKFLKCDDFWELGALKYTYDILFLLIKKSHFEDRYENLLFEQLMLNPGYEQSDLIKFACEKFNKLISNNKLEDAQQYDMFEALIKAKTEQDLEQIEQDIIEKNHLN